MNIVRQIIVFDAADLAARCAAAGASRSPRRRPGAARMTRSSRSAGLLQPADDLTAVEGHQVYADPAGHPFCIGWGH